jgi:excinuclease ABC, C subunit
MGIPDIQSKLENLPSNPGVYQFKDISGRVIYVGKTKSLKNRVRQYFQSRPVTGRLAIMISKIADVEIITTDSEVEALLLELNLIKEIKPRYNVSLKDDKSFPYIVITNEPYPRVFPTRRKRNDGSKYFGPYTDVKNMRFALKVIRGIFMIRSCSLNITRENIENKKFKICLDYHIHKCEGPCEGLVSAEDYNEMIRQVAKLLNGKTGTLLKELNSLMENYATQMQYEKAARTRDKIEAIQSYSSKQKMVEDEMIDRDVFAIEKEDNDACGMVLIIRDGKVLGKSHFYFNNVIEKNDEEIIEKLVTNYYTNAEFIPDEIHLETEIENMETIKLWLEKRKQRSVKFFVPKIGDKAKLVNMVKKNAKLMLGELKLTKLKKEFKVPSVESLRKDLRLEKLPRRIECFDISHIQGTDTVASMVSFFDGKPRKSEYRKYKLLSVLNEAGKPDDFLSMREVIHRRYKRLIEENKNLPDLIVIDGGKGQLSSAVRVLEDIGIKPLSAQRLSHDTPHLSPAAANTVSVIGLAKRLEEVFFPGDSDPYSIPKTSGGLKLLQRIRDEAHRFAVEFHRSLREKRTLTSELETIAGIGQKTAQKLLKDFGSVEKLKEEILNNFDEVVANTGWKTAEKLKNFFYE